MVEIIKRNGLWFLLILLAIVAGFIIANYIIVKLIFTIPHVS